MARLLADEDFPRPVSLHLRNLGHDVQLAVETGLANRKTEDRLLLDYAFKHQRVLLTHYRRHFRKLHGSAIHAGMVVCTRSLDFVSLAEAIDHCLVMEADCSNRMIHVTKGGVTVHEK
jgi:hypothetical protein